MSDLFTEIMTEGQEGRGQRADADAEAEAERDT